jgi:hypothetical protein
VLLLLPTLVLLLSLMLLLLLILLLLPLSLMLRFMVGVKKVLRSIASLLHTLR